MEKKKKISFKLPETIKHKEARKIISDLVKQLNDRGQLEIADIPQLHRMATAYDAYLECVEVLAQDGMTMKNLKGEWVKRPEANLLKENWSQYLELAKEYGLTAKSKGQIKAMNAGDNEESPLEAYLKGKKETR
ncbi:Chemotaxis protein CheC -- inhibitor of MCP methylation [Bacteroides ovatus]|jgi:P27 family predicted phage terminase small subunit|uniref:phage terminase small subunit P27 family n=1 Tax=Bacteroides TaxID=816 RepID=UPI000E9AF415|nr:MULTISPECIES: phage terminase small subunit P27 family [Bacteroides]DAZ61904.1 MAG TPA: terminase small subunit [Caudoviricetes sp.]MCS3178436.1 phage terminase small subunit P27 family [Candidatus Bacteroides intestinigallinarum]RGN52607.1 phage terminase small subunit P27 family [Bacteroides sp. OM05-10AA]RGQ56615.1 phage terminase small subunit P27 family [Bacteroides sp. AF27-33]CAG9891952.1 Chemotaxis protein CheC -- inhibitor of MCP methylation [Bacteroides ovatus]